MQAAAAWLERWQPVCALKSIDFKRKNQINIVEPLLNLSPVLQTAEVQGDLSSTASRLAAAEAQLSDLARQLGSEAPSALSGDLTALQSRLAEARGKLGHVSEQLRSTRGDLEVERSSLEDSSSLLDQTRRQGRELKQAVAEAEAAAEEVRRQLSFEEAERMAVEEEAEEAQAYSAQRKQV